MKETEFTQKDLQNFIRIRMRYLEHFISDEVAYSKEARALTKKELQNLKKKAPYLWRTRL